jgi:hypothetical protein
MCSSYRREYHVQNPGNRLHAFSSRMGRHMNPFLTSWHRVSFTRGTCASNTAESKHVYASCSIET